MSNQTNDQITNAQKLKEQCKDKEALDLLNNIENLNELTEEEQISYYLLQSSLFYYLGQYNKALDTANWVFQKSIKTGNDLIMLDASLAKGKALYRLGKNKECYRSILKCEELISRKKDQPEKLIWERKTDLVYIKARYNWQIGKFDKYLEFSKIYLSLSDKYGTKRDTAIAFNSIGIYYIETGDFAKALENYKKVLKISKELKNKIGMAAAYNNIGETFRLQGDLDSGLEYYKHGLSLNEEIGRKYGISTNLDNIGMTYYEKGELDKGLKYLKKGLKLRKEIGNNFETSRTLFYIIKNNLDQNKLESVQTYLEDINNLSEKKDKTGINHRYRIAKALIFKKTGSTLKVFEAGTILNETLRKIN